MAVHHPLVTVEYPNSDGRPIAESDFWRQPKGPDFVLEITSHSTRSQDQGPKRGTYAFWQVQEYFQYDPTDDYLRPPLQGLRLVGDHYAPLPSTVSADGTLSILSETLGLELRVKDRELHFYHPATGRKLFTYRETEQARQEAETQRQTALTALQEA